MAMRRSQAEGLFPLSVQLSHWYMEKSGVAGPQITDKRFEEQEVLWGMLGHFCGGMVRRQILKSDPGDTDNQHKGQRAGVISSHLHTLMPLLCTFTEHLRSFWRLWLGTPTRSVLHRYLIRVSKVRWGLNLTPSLVTERNVLVGKGDMGYGRWLDLVWGANKSSLSEANQLQEVVIHLGLYPLKAGRIYRW